MSVWVFLGDFFEDMMTGEKKHLAYLKLSRQGTDKFIPLIWRCAGRRKSAAHGY